MVFDAEGRALGGGFREYGVVCDAPGQAEQDAERVWALTKETLREAVLRSGSDDIRALSISAQGDAIIPVDRDFQALHPAILGMDYRSERQTDHCASVFGAFDLFQRTGMRPHPMNSLSKVLFLRESQPAVFEQAARIVTYADYILGKLGGEAVIDHTMASRTMAFDLATLEWSRPIHEALGLSERMWSRPAPSGTVAGAIRRSVAEETGLPSGLVLVTGGHDQTCAALGAGVVQPGVGVVSTGTAEVLSTVLDPPVLSRQMFDSYYPCYRHANPGKHFTFALNHTGGILLRWWRDHFAGEEVREAARRGIDAYRLIDERAPTGPSPVMFLPHLNGAGTPTCDLRSKGVIAGLTLATTRHDIAQAVLEGLTFELRTNLETMAACGVAVDELVAAGGGAKSGKWLQLKADILNRPLRTLRCREAACLGAAMLAAKAVGLVGSVEEAAARWVYYEREFAPVADQAAAYAERYSVYRQLYPAIRAFNEKL
jgi:xylulokinase